MEIKINLPDNFVSELLENLPEYSISFEVKSFNYKRNEFELMDYETGKDYVLDLPTAENGFRLLIQKVTNSELPGLGLEEFWEPGNWDSYSTDALLQCALLGDVIYG
jgi:hypothetical protein